MLFSSLRSLGGITLAFYWTILFCWFLILFWQFHFGFGLGNNRITGVYQFLKWKSWAALNDKLYQGCTSQNVWMLTCNSQTEPENLMIAIAHVENMLGGGDCNCGAKHQYTSTKHCINFCFYILTEFKYPVEPNISSQNWTWSSLVIKLLKKSISEILKLVTHSSAKVNKASLFIAPLSKLWTLTPMTFLIGLNVNHVNKKIHFSKAERIFLGNHTETFIYIPIHMSLILHSIQNCFHCFFLSSKIFYTITHPF